MLVWLEPVPSEKEASRFMLFEDGRNRTRTCGFEDRRSTTKLHPQNWEQQDSNLRMESKRFYRPSPLTARQCTRCDRQDSNLEPIN